MISEQEAREAAARLKNGGGDAFACWEDYQESSQKDEDVEVAANWICQELARREAERIERAKPIDAEWCSANGSAFDLGWMRFYGPECVVLWCESIVWVASKEWKLSMRKIKTRGQLLDLLAALKGGE